MGTNVNSVFYLPEKNDLPKYLKTLRFKMKWKKFYKTLCWFKEKWKTFDFEFRFTGEETKNFVVISYTSLKIFLVRVETLSNLRFFCNING